VEDLPTSISAGLSSSQNIGRKSEDVVARQLPIMMESRTQESVLVLEAGRTERHYWRDLWTYRELFAILAWRDLVVRYKQTFIGVAWAVIRPVLTLSLIHI